MERPMRLRLRMRLYHVGYTEDHTPWDVEEQFTVNGKKCVISFLPGIEIRVVLLVTNLDRAIYFSGFVGQGVKGRARVRFQRLNITRFPAGHAMIFQAI